MKKFYMIPVFAMITGVSFGQWNTVNIPEREAVKGNQILKTGPMDPGQSGSRNIIWQNNFDIPGDWTMSNTSTPATDWIITNTIPTNLSGQNFQNINSTSGGNFAIIDSDGPGQSASQNARMVTTNPINLSSYQGVILNFQNSHRRYQEKHFVLISTDGVNWTEIPVNVGYTANTSSPNPENVSVNLTSYIGGQQTAYIGFRYEGAYDWFWMIDDVELEEAPENDLTLGYRFYGEFSKVPLSQVTPLGFVGSVINNGFGNQTNVKLNVKVTGGSSGTFDETSAPIASLAAGAIDTIYLAQQFTPSDIGNYSIAYEISQDQVDGNPADNMLTTGFSVSDSIFSRDNDRYTNMGYSRANKATYTLGNVFNVENAGYLTSISFVLTYLTEVGAEVRIKLHDADFEILATSEVYDIVASDINAEVTQALNAPKTVTLTFNEPYFVEKGEYLVGVEHLNAAANVSIATGTDIMQPLQQAYVNYNNDWFYLTSTPMIRMNMSHVLAINEKAANASKLFVAQPNPANSQTSIRYELGNTTNVSLQIMDLSGKTVLSINEGVKNPGAYTINVNTTSLDNGIYFYTLVTKEGRKTQKLVVAK
ncbi:MAG: T9SS type A sorting domain-containing protein [Bacteroidetes bacterium]|nr:T9SS type A sorting domain-containing protein [Bacteroidota bacterium]